MHHNPQEHLTGKQYLGWKRIREHYAELSARLGRSGRASAEPPHPSEYDRDRDRHRSSRDRSRSPGGGGGSGDRRRDHHRDYDRGSSRYGGSGGADRDRDYGRDRGRDDRYDSREHRGSRRVSAKGPRQAGRDGETGGGGP